jgi:hypothetical protein
VIGIHNIVIQVHYQSHPLLVPLFLFLGNHHAQSAISTVGKPSPMPTPSAILSPLLSPAALSPLAVAGGAKAVVVAEFEAMEVEVTMGERSEAAFAGLVIAGLDVEVAEEKKDRSCCRKATVIGIPHIDSGPVTTVLEMSS